MASNFAQLDKDILRRFQRIVRREPRRDRRALAAHGVLLAAELDEMLAKSAGQCFEPTQRVHECCTTWGELHKATSWPGGTTSLRAALDTMTPNILALPRYEGGVHQGIRILRLDTAGQGLVRDIEGKVNDKYSMRRMAMTETVLRSIVSCIDPLDHRSHPRDLAKRVDELFDLWHRRAETPPRFPKGEVPARSVGADDDWGWWTTEAVTDRMAGSIHLFR